MVSINFDSELRRAGAHSTHGWRRLAFLAQRYLLGTFGLIIMVLFVWMAISADLICRYDPLSVNSRTDWFRRACSTGWERIRSAAMSGAGSFTAHVFHWPSASARRRWVIDRRARGSRIRLSFRLGRPGLPAHHRYPAGPAAAGAGAGDDGGAGPLAAKRDHRDCHSADPDGRPRDPRQYAGAARATLRRGRQVDRHERVPHCFPPRSAQHAGAADRAGDRAARLHHSHRSLAVVSRPRHSRALSVVGTDAVGIGGGICPHRAMAGDLPGRRDQPCGVRHQFVRRRARDILDPRQRG